MITNVNSVLCEDYNTSRPLGTSTNMVSTSGNQTVGGIKTFSSNPIFNASTAGITLQPGGGSSFQYNITTAINPSANRNIGFYDPLADCNLSFGIKRTITLSPTVTPQSLSIAQSDSIVFLPQATASIVINLPAATAGWNCKVILTAVADGTHTVTFSAPTAILSGTRYGVVAAPVGVSATNQTNLILSATAANAVVGDNITFMSDGTKIYYTAWSNGTGAAFSTS